MTKEVLNDELHRGDESLRSAIVLMRESLCLDAMSRCYHAVLHQTLIRILM